MEGILKDISIDGSICIITLEDADTGKESTVKAETRLFMTAIDDCYGDNWKEKIIEYEIDSIGCMTAFQPTDLDLDETL